MFSDSEGQYKVMVSGLLALVLIGLTFVGPVTAHAQDEHDRALARALFAEGLERMDDEDFEQAADRFRRARDLYAVPPVLYNLARADAHIGRLVEAAESLRQLLRDEATDAQLELEARAVLQAIEPRLARLSIQLDGSADSVSVFVNERPIPVAGLGVSMPADPGTLVVRALRGDQEVARSEVTLAEGEAAEVVLTLTRATISVQTPSVPTPEQTAVMAQPATQVPYDDTPLHVGLTVTAILVATVAVVVAVLAATGVFSPMQPHCGNADPCVLEAP